MRSTTPAHRFRPSDATDKPAENFDRVNAISTERRAALSPGERARRGPRNRRPLRTTRRRPPRALGNASLPHLSGRAEAKSVPCAHDFGQRGPDDCVSLPSTWVVARVAGRADWSRRVRPHRQTGSASSASGSVLRSSKAGARRLACLGLGRVLLLVQPSTPRDVPPRLAERDGPGAEVDRHVSPGVDDSAGARAPQPPATFTPIPR